MEKQIWFSQKHKNYYSEQESSCSECSRKCVPLRIDIVGFNPKKQSEEQKIKSLCVDCWPDYKQINNFEMYRVVQMCKPPEDAILIFNVPPAVKVGGTSDWVVFNPIGRGPVQTEDRTVYAGRESLEGARVGKDVSSELEVLDKHLVEEKEAFGIIDGITKDSVVVAPELIEEKKNGELEE